MSKGHEVFGLQNKGECWTGKADTKFDKHSRAINGCRELLGCSLMNIVYKKKEWYQVGEWRYKGCFKDDTKRSIPELLLDRRLGHEIRYM